MNDDDDLDELLAAELERDDDDDVEDRAEHDDGAARELPASFLYRAKPRPPRRAVADPATRAALLELVGIALEAKTASELEDDDRALGALERTVERAGVLADMLRGRLSDLVPTVPVAPPPDREQQP